MELTELSPRLYELCLATGWNHQRALELAMMGCSALGRGFVESPVYMQDRLTLESMIAHPLLRDLDCVDRLELGLRGLVEVGLYLETFANDAALPEVLVALRNPRLYKSTFFQLAVAHRIARATNNQTTLEPKTQRGKADICFTFDGKTYLAECYRIDHDFLDYIGRFESLLAERLVDGTPEGRVLRLSLHMKGELSYDMKRRCLSALDTQLGAYQANHGPNSSTTEVRGVRLVLEDVSDAKDDDHSYAGERPYLEVGGRARLISDLAELSELQRQPPLPLGSRARFFMETEKSWPRGPWQKLERRMGAKLRQTKPLAGDLGRLLFVEFPWGANLPEQILEDSQEVHQAFVRRFPAVSAVIVMQRVVDGNAFRYSGATLLGDPSVEVPDNFIDKLHAIEMRPLW